MISLQIGTVFEWLYITKYSSIIFEKNMHVAILLPSWTALPDLPTERKSSAAAGLGDLVIGSFNNTRSLSNA